MNSSALHRILIASVLLVSSLLHSVDSLAQGGTISFAQLQREAIEARLRRFSRKNEERQTTLRRMFIEAGCDNDRLNEQLMPDRKQANVICTREGGAQSVVIVGAHFDHAEEYGLGVVDNWSGASLLPSLFESLKPYSPKHAIRFIGFAEEEKGLLGSAFYVKELKQQELARVRLMIDIDSLGLGPTKVWLNHSNREMADSLALIAGRLHIPVGVVNADLVGDEDSTSFRRRHVPTLMLHSITQQTFGILHSPNDNFSQIHMDDYYDSYRLIYAYLIYIDSLLD